MPSKHDEIMTYNSIVDTSVSDNEEEIYLFIGELGELPKDFVSTSVMITEDIVLQIKNLSIRLNTLLIH